MLRSAFDGFGMRLVIYWTAAERRALSWSRGVLRTEAVFAADDAGLAGFRAYLERRAGAVATLVADVAGEEFHEEEIPRLRGRERAAVVERRLAQRFPGMRLAAALPLARNAATRHRDRVLLASFANPHLFAPWLDALGAARVRLAGFYSTALLLPALLPPDARRAASVIVASLHAQGLRACHVEHGHLRFARFESIPAADPEHYAARVHAEIGRLADYLASVRALPRDDQPLPLVVIGREAERRPLAVALAADGRFALHFESLEGKARSLGVRAAPAGFGAEQLALALAASRPPRIQFAHGTDRLPFLRARLRRALVAGGTLGFAACAAIAGTQALELLPLREQAQAARLEAQEATRRHERLVAAFPEMPTSAENLRLTVEELRRIAARAALPEEALAQVAAALDLCPLVMLDALDWRAEPQAHSGATAVSGPTQTIEISGRIAAPPGTDLRALDAEAERFAAALQAKGWRTGRSQRPHDMTPQGRLIGDGRNAAAPDTARFVLVIARPPE